MADHLKKFVGFGNIGAYPPEYVRKVHGPYDPSRYYGKPDTAFGQVKLSELPSWIGRRSFHPLNIGRAMGRGYWRWLRKYTMVRFGGPTPFLQLAVGLSIIYYIGNYNHIRYHSHAKYH